jgi:hypothetical protein
VMLQPGSIAKDVASCLLQLELSWVILGLFNLNKIISNTVKLLLLFS